MRYPVPGNRLKPEDWALQKLGRRHQQPPKASIKRHQESVDQSHIVKVGKPGQRDTFRTMIEAIIYICQVAKDVSVADHHPFWRRSRARRVLQIS